MCILATVGRVAIATQVVDGIDCSMCFRPSHFKDCVAIAMCLIVALFFLTFRTFKCVATVTCLIKTAPRWWSAM